MGLGQISVWSFALTAVLATVPAGAALAWGNEGHEIVALIAAHYLTPAATSQVNALLATDTQNTLTAHDIASEATWADAFRSHGGSNTSLWHYADIEIATGDVAEACFNFPPLSAGQVASDGPAQDCVVDKIDEFEAELLNTNTAPAEKLLALKYLLHFVGDVHQPLHSADENDRGGNDKIVEGQFSKAKELHAFWDTTVVSAQGADATTVSSELIGQITPAQIIQWQTGATKDWALEAFQIAKAISYGELPAADNAGKFDIPAAYLNIAEPVAAGQLSRAGVRLAYLLNRAFPS